jgi:AcrR family transcriptional regulator
VSPRDRRRGSESVTPRRREAGDRLGIPSDHAELPATARRILEAARAVLQRSGPRAFSLEAVSSESGEKTSLIWYYFGGKAGLLIALIDWMIYDQLRDLQQRVEEMPPCEERQRMAADHARLIAGEPDAYLQGYSIWPYAMENRQARRRLAAWYAHYREINARALSLDGENSEDTKALGAMLVALTDGLANQLMWDSGCLNMDRIMALWEILVRAVLSATLQGQERPNGVRGGDATSE